MATLNSTEKTQIRRFLEAKALSLGVPVSWVKAVVNDAAQAIEDCLEGTALLQRAEISPSGTGFPAVISARIDAATQAHGITLTAAQKKHLFAVVISLKFARDRV